MTPLIIFLPFILILGAVIIFFDKIYCFFKPEKYLMAYILTKSNYIEKILIKKTEKPSFIVSKQEYITNNEIPYKSGRVQAFIYNEGEKDPLDLRKLTVQENMQMWNRVKELNLADLWATESGIGNFIQQHSGIIMLVIGAIVIFLLWKNGQAPKAQEVLNTLPK